MATKPSYSIELTCEGIALTKSGGKRLSIWERYLGNASMKALLANCAVP